MRSVFDFTGATLIEGPVWEHDGCESCVYQGTVQVWPQDYDVYICADHALGGNPAVTVRKGDDGSDYVWGDCYDKNGWSWRVYRLLEELKALRPPTPIGNRSRLSALAG